MSERDFERDIADALKRDAQALDPELRRRLREARRTAVDEIGERRPLIAAISEWFSPGRALVPAASVAAVAVAVLGARVLMTAPEVPALSPLDDIEIVMAEDDLELYEDLDFYLWMELEESGELADEA